MFEKVILSEFIEKLNEELNIHDAIVLNENYRYLPNAMDRRRKLFEKYNFIIAIRAELGNDIVTFTFEDHNHQVIRFMNIYDQYGMKYEGDEIYFTEDKFDALTLSLKQTIFEYLLEN